MLFRSDKGAAVILRDEQLADAQDGLVARATALLSDAPALHTMRASALGAGQRDGAERIASLLIEIAETRTSKGDRHD